MHQFLWTDEQLFRSAWIMSIPSAGTPFLSTTPEDKDDLVKSYAKACGCPVSESVGDAVNCLLTTDVSIMTNESVAWVRIQMEEPFL